MFPNFELLRGSQQKRHLVCQDANSAGMVSTCRTTPSIGGPRKCLMVEVVIDGNILIKVCDHLCWWEFEKSNLWSIPKTWAWQHSGRGWGELSFSAERTVSIRSGGPQRSRWLPSSQLKSRQHKKSLRYHLILKVKWLHWWLTGGTFANGERFRLSKACRSPALTWDT